MLRLGVHVSIGKKIYFAIDRSVKLGCNTIQIFSRNPRQWRRRKLSSVDINEFRKRRQGNNIDPLSIHIPYTLNLSAANTRFYRITIREFIEDLFEADSLGADFLITHMGSYKGLKDESEGIKRVSDALIEILHKTDSVGTKILLENTAGNGKWLGYSFEQIGAIISRLSFTPRIGVCLDTAHAWAAGYNLVTAEGIESMCREIDRWIGLDRIKIIHLNDTQYSLGSRKDRHWHLGEGQIGKEGISLIINHHYFKDIPFILETPKKSDYDDLRNLEYVRSLYEVG